MKYWFAYRNKMVVKNCVKKGAYRARYGPAYHSHRLRICTIYPVVVIIVIYYYYLREWFNHLPEMIERSAKFRKIRVFWPLPRIVYASLLPPPPQRWVDNNNIIKKITAAGRGDRPPDGVFSFLTQYLLSEQIINV